MGPAAARTRPAHVTSERVSPSAGLPDLHNTGGTIATGDTWLANNLPAILNSTYYTGNTTSHLPPSTAVFVTWDEGEGSDKTHGENCADATHADTATYPSCWVATIVISPSTRTGTTSTTYFNHYSLLRTAEDLLGLSPLGLAASNASMSWDFRL
jgi:phosphatidylinositol-3-phosphatase